MNKWEDNFNQYKHLIPQHMWPGVIRYIEKGARPGSFLSYVLKNDFLSAVCSADEENYQRMGQWAQFLRFGAPAASIGSSEIFETWIEHGGIEGLDKLIAQND